MSTKRSALKEDAFTGRGLCALYDEHARLFMRSVYRHFVRKLAGLNPSGVRVLDIGTGSALLSIELIRTIPRDWRVTAVDISPDMLEIARRNVLRYGCEQRIELKAASAGVLPFPDRSFDLVISNASLHQWAEPAAAFNEIARVVRRGGLALVRDNLRLSSRWRPLIDLVSRVKGMNRIQHDLWINAIQSAYTVHELNSILSRTCLADYHVSVNPAFLDLQVLARF